jgi:hypothetical protein
MGGHLGKDILCRLRTRASGNQGRAARPCCALRADPRTDNAGEKVAKHIGRGHKLVYLLARLAGCFHGGSAVHNLPQPVSRVRL